MMIAMVVFFYDNPALASFGLSAIGILDCYLNYPPRDLIGIPFLNLMRFFEAMGFTLMWIGAYVFNLGVFNKDASNTIGNLYAIMMFLLLIIG